MALLTDLQAEESDKMLPYFPTDSTN